MRIVTILNAAPRRHTIRTNTNSNTRLFYMEKMFIHTSISNVRTVRNIGKNIIIKGVLTNIIQVITTNQNAIATTIISPGILTITMQNNVLIIR